MGLLASGEKEGGQTRKLAAVLLCLLLVGWATAQPETISLGSKRNPEGHLFTYDQKFRESTRFMTGNNVSASGNKQFEGCTRLSTWMDLRLHPDWLEMAISANWSGTGRMTYTVYDPESSDPREQMSYITHMFIGNFTLDEHLRVVKDRAQQSFLPPL